jgi:hypothetical protein
MFKKYNVFKKILVFFLLFLIITACTHKPISEDLAGYISVDEGSNYKETFDDLGIGRVFNYNLHLLEADESWVNVWLEGYQNGQLIEPNPLSGMNYGLSLNEEERGKMGFGIINSNIEPLVFFYTHEIRVHPKMIQEDVFLNKGISLWNYAIDEEKVQLKYGEEKILAVYRENEESIRTGYDYENDEIIDEVIRNNETVLFFKIKVEKAK